MNIEEYRNSRSTSNKKKSIKYIKSHIISFINKCLLTILIFMIGLIVTKDNAKVKDFINKNIYTETFKFTEVKNLYNKYIGKYFGSLSKTTTVFTEKLSYTKTNVYKDGVALTVTDNYLVPSLESGIVIFIGNKDGYGNTLIIEQINGIDVWYSNIDIKNIKMYDYIEKGALLGEVKDKKLYLLFQKDGKFLDYKKYI